MTDVYVYCHGVSVLARRFGKGHMCSRCGQTLRIVA